VYCGYKILEADTWKSFSGLYDSEIFNYLNAGICLVGLAVNVISNVLGLFISSKRWNFLETIDDVDRVLQDEFYVVYPSENMLRIFMLLKGLFIYSLSSVSFGLFIYFIEYVFYFELNIYVLTGIVLGHLVFNVYNSEFMFVILAIKRRFAYINFLLDQIVKDENEDLPVEKTKVSIYYSEIQNMYGRKTELLDVGEKQEEEKGSFWKRLMEL
jgi:hypothetical protein